MSSIKEKIREKFIKAGFGSQEAVNESLDNLIPVIAFEDGYMVFRNGTVGKGYEVDSVEMERWEQGSYSNFNRVFQNALGFLPKDTIVQKLDIYFEDRKATPEKADNYFESKYYGHFMERPFYNHKSYLFITSPTEQRYTEANNLFVQYKKIDLKESLKSVDQTKEKWKAVTSEFEGQMRSVEDIKFHTTTDEENKNIYRSMLNMEFRYENPDTFKAITNNENYLVIGDTKVNILSMYGQASEIEDTRYSFNGVIAPFTYNVGIMYQTPHIVCRAYRVLDTEEQLKKLDRLVNINTGNSFGGEAGQIKAEQIKELTTNTRATQGTLVDFSMCIATMSKGEKRRIESNIETRGEMLSWEGSEIILESFNNTTQFFSMLPGNSSQSCRWIVMPTNIAMCYNDFTTNVKGTEDGELVADRFRNILKFKLYNTNLVNQNALLIGPSGSGKSFTVGHFVLQRFNKGIRQIILDVGGTYKQIFDAVGGKFYEYDPENPISFNPFLVKYNEETKLYDIKSDKLDFIKSLCAYLITGDKLSKAQNSAYDILLPKYYEHESKMRASGNDDREIKLPCLANLSDWIQSYYFDSKDEKDSMFLWKVFEPENFVFVLKPYVSGVHKRLLNSPDVLDISEHLLVCFDMAKVKDNLELYPLVTMLLSELALDVIRKYPNELKVFLMDEAWSMLKDGMGEFVEYMYRTLRKNKGQMMIITQGITEIVNSKVGKALINNAETKIILRHTNTNELANLQAHLGFTDSEISKLANLQFTKGARQFFVKQGENSDVYTLEVPLEETAVLTSQPDERNHLIALKNKYLGKITNAIQQWVEDVKNNNIKKS